MTEQSSRVGERRPGGRAERVRLAILESTTDLLLQGGYDRLSVDEVAERAGVHKTTVYRRWPSKAELVAAAVTLRSEQQVAIADTGTLLGDLDAFARAVANNLGSSDGSQWSHSIVAAASSSGDLADAMHEFWAERLALSEPIIERAISRGELPEDSDANLIIETLVGPLWLRLLLTGEPIDEGFASRVAELVARGSMNP